jgi:AP-4 complex subunit beta-1
VADIDVHISRLAVRSMTRIACRNCGGPGCEQSVARRLVEMLDLNIDHICSEAATGLSHLLRKHPELKDAIAPPLPRTLRYIQEPRGKASIIYLLGECGDVVPEAPYTLEKLIDQYDTLTDPAIKSALLSSTMKLFFLRPPETQKMLGRLLAKATDDVSSQDLHDRGLLYYRMLQTDPAVVEAAIKTNPTLGELVNFTEDDDVELKKKLMKEFNTLAILYGKTSENFIAEKYQVTYTMMPPEHPLPPGVDPGVMQLQPMTQQQQQAPPDAAPAGGGMVMDLLGFDGGGGAPPAPAPVAPPTAAGLSLKPVTLSGDEYQAHWGAIPDGEATVTAIPIGAIPSSTDQVERTLGAYNVLTMASGELPTEFKFFLYAADEASGELFLVQSNLVKSGEPLLIVTIKATGPSAVGKVEQLVGIIGSALS